MKRLPRHQDLRPSAGRHVSVVEFVRLRFSVEWRVVLAFYYSRVNWVGYSYVIAHPIWYVSVAGPRRTVAFEEEIFVDALFKASFIYSS